MEEYVSLRNFADFYAIVTEKPLNTVLNENNKVAQEIEKFESATNRICSNKDCKMIYKKIKCKYDNCNSNLVK